MNKENTFYLVRDVLLNISLFTFISFSYAQKSEIDSLGNLDYLKKVYYDAYYSDDYELASKYAKKYLSVAKKNKKDIEALIKGHHYNSMVSDQDSFIIKHLDSAITYGSKLSNQFRYPALSHFEMGMYYYDKRNFPKALDNFLIGLDISQNNKNHDFVSMFKNSLGLIKLERINKEREALILFKDCEKYYDTVPDVGDKYFNKLTAYFALATTYTRLQKLDSSDYYIKKGHKISLQNEDLEYAEYFNYLDGINEYIKGNILTAQSILKGSYKTIERSSDYINLNEINYYLGVINIELNKKKEALNNFKRIDSIYDIYPMYSIQIRKGFEELISYHKENQNQEEQLKFVLKLLEVDSLYINDYESIVHTMNTRYDNNLLIESKRKLQSDLQITKKNSSIKSYYAIIMTIALFIGIVYYRKKQSQFKEKFDEILNNDSDTKRILKPAHDLEIDKNIIEEVLMKLERFEVNEEYVEHNITLNSIAKKFKYNNKYVSLIINQYKGVSIIQYINDLRIDYCIDKIKKDRLFRNYTIESIANEVGFNNARSFNSAFIKKNKISAFAFIKKIQKEGANSLN